MRLIAVIFILFFAVVNAVADTFEAKYNTSQWLPIVVLDGTDGLTPETGVVYTGVTFWYKEGESGTWTQLTLSANSCTASNGNWCEESSTNAPGSYRVYVPNTITDTKGKLYYLVKGSGYKTYWGALSVKTYVADEESDKFPSSGTIPNTSTVMPDPTGVDNIEDKLPTNYIMGSSVQTAKDDAIDAILADTGTDGVVLANDAITAAKIAASAITSSEAPNLDVAVSTRLAPTVAGRTLDITTTGEAGIDLDNTSGTLAKSSEITGFNDIAATNIVSGGPITTNGGVADSNVLKFGGTVGSFSAGRPEVNSTHIMSDSIAAANLRDAYNGTGYAGQGIAVTVANITPGTCTSSPIPATCWKIEITTEAAVVVDGDQVGKQLCVGLECKEILKSDDAAGNDFLWTEPFVTAPDNATGYIR